MKEKLASFFKKLNNSHLIVAICAILIGVIFLSAMISLVAHPFVKGVAYSARLEEASVGTIKAKLTLLNDGRYSVTVYHDSTKETMTTFGDYGYGKIFITDDDSHRVNAIWFDSLLNPIKLTNPFKIENNGVVYTCGGGIALLVFYCIAICICAAIAAIMIVKRREGVPAFTSKMRLIKRLKEMEQMLGIYHDAPVANSEQTTSDVQE